LPLPKDKRTVFLLSESGTEDELHAVGLKTIGGTDPAFRRDVDVAVDLPALSRGEGLDDSVGAVLLALDFHVNYLKLAHAMTYVRRGATLLATNEDSTLPLGGSFFPGAGSVGLPVVNATKVKPKVMGKPHTEMMEAIEGQVKFDKTKTCMVGDRLDTDIQFGIDGWLGGTFMVCTGVNTREDAESGSIRPKFIATSLGDLLAAKDELLNIDET
jgi:4-nitrophenyl phosphatase